MWIVLALTAAASAALRDVASKQAARRADPLVIALGVAGVPAVLLGGIVLALGPVPPGDGFWTALLVSGGINAVATPLIVVALKRSDLSLVAPLTSLTPLFMVGTGALVLGELPGPWGVAGMTTLVAGAWLLALPDRPVGILDPFRALARDRGARAMLLVALLYSVSGAYDKVGVAASSPLLWAASINLLVAVALGGLVAARRVPAARGGRSAARGTGSARAADDGGLGAAAGPASGPVSGAAPVIVLAGVLAAGMAATQMTALLLTLAAYVIAVKRVSTLVGVLLGHAVFGERHLRQRLAGAVVMLAGFTLLVLRG